MAAATTTTRKHLLSAGRTYEALWWRCSGSCFRKHPCSRPNVRRFGIIRENFQFFSGFSKLFAAD